MKEISSLYFRFRSSASWLKVETRLDSVSGSIIGTLETGLTVMERPGVQENSRWKTHQMSIEKIDDQHDLFFVINSDEDAYYPTMGILQLEAIYFHSIDHAVTFELIN